MWNLTGLKEGSANITVNASCQSDFYPLDNLFSFKIYNLTVIDLTAPHISLFYPYNNTEVTNPVNINFNTSDESDILNCSLFLNNVINITVYPSLFSVYTINITLPAGNYKWKIGCYDNSSNRNYNESETRLFLLPSWNFFYGNLSSRIKLGTSQNASVLDWDANPAANIYIIETGASVDFSQLQALGRNISNMSRSNDFEEADINLSMTAFSDSINLTYTVNNIPVNEIELTIYDKTVKNIPVFNSTNTSNFLTGILWDMSDGLPEYNGSQDIIFVSQKNLTNYGKYGLYDYEMRMPASLKNRKYSSGTVSFYVEII
jgi:hypothetical protein